MTFQNNSDRAKILDTPSISLLDSEGRKSMADGEQFRYIPTDQNLFLENVEPGVAKQGQAIYSVAEGASGFRLYVEETEPVSQDAGYIELGF